MAKWRLVILMVIASFGSGFRAAAEPLRLTIADALERATGASMDVSESRRDLSSAKANLKRTKPWLPDDPSVSFGAYHSTIQQDIFNDIGEQVGRRGYGPNYTVSLSQEFEVAGQRGLRISAAREEVERARRSLHWQRQGLAASVRTAYLAASVAAQRLTLAQRAHDAVRELRQPAADNEPRGSSETVAANALRLQESYTRRDVARAKQSRNQAFALLARLCRLPTTTDIELVEMANIREQPLASVDELVGRAIAQRLDLAAQQHALVAAESSITARKWERIPNVTIGASVSQFAGATLAGGDVNVPIPLFRGRTGDLDEALAERNHQARQLDLLKADIEKQVVDAYQACDAAAAELATYRDEILPVNEENLRLQRELRADDQISAAELIATQVDYFTAQSEYLDAVADYNGRLIELEAAVGGVIGPEPAPPPTPASSGAPDEAATAPAEDPEAPPPTAE